MTSHTGRLYGLALALFVFFLAWAAIAAKPWALASTDSRERALVLRERQLRREGVLVRRIVGERNALYRQRLRERNAAITAARRRELASVAPAAAPVRVVDLPPATITRTS
jgi:hypothetical protein